MKPTLLLTLFISCIFSCSTLQNNNFSRQKHTNFGHGKGIRFTANNDSEKIQKVKSENKESFQQTAVSEMSFAEVVKDSTVMKDSLLPVQRNFREKRIESPLRKYQQEDDGDEFVPESDSLNGIIYAQQLKREAKRHAVIGISSIVMGTAILSLVPYALPIFFVLLILGAVFLAIAAHKLAKKNELLKDPTKYKNPKDKSIYRRNNRTLIIALSIAGYCAFLIAGAILAYLIVTLIAAEFTIVLFFLIVGIILCFLIAMTGLILLMIAAIEGRNYTRARRLNDEPRDMAASVLTPVNWSIIAAAFISLVTWFGNLFTRP